MYEFIVYEFLSRKCIQATSQQNVLFLLALKSNFLFSYPVFYIYPLTTKDAIDFKPFSWNEWKGFANSK